MKFIDLFAGIGGFHQALHSLGHECVFASEINEELRKLYQSNFGLECQGDIAQIKISRIPKHDILCAGFPCQSFSKAGGQGGLDDERGNLFHYIAKILKYHKSKFFILENVPNFEHHEDGRTWEIVRNILSDELKYDIDLQKLSPHNYGTPQLRERLFIIGSRKGLSNFSWPLATQCELDIRTILEPHPRQLKLLPPREQDALALWQKLLDALPTNAALPSFPIWAMEFRATYPLDGFAPYHTSRTDLNKYLGAFGQSLHGMTKRDQLERLPKYARAKQKKKVFPKWKVNFIQGNRAFYAKYRKYIDPLLPAIESMPPSWQKFEWNCKGMNRNLYEGIIQFRGSGIRVKRPNYSPALVASTSTQRPIIGWAGRYISSVEAARLQDLEGLKLPTTESSTFKALGNAVNAKVVRLIAANLVGTKRGLLYASPVQSSSPQQEINTSARSNKTRTPSKTISLDKR